MRLSELLADVPIEEIVGEKDREISSFRTGSREVKKGDLFIAIKGALSDGHRFIPDALEKGARAVVCEALPEELDREATYVRVKDSRRASNLIAANYYGHPEKSLYIIGITGTKGKTTTAEMVKTILDEAGIKTGLIGSNGAFFGKKRVVTSNTTPDGPTLFKFFSEMKKEGITHVVMEASSQAFKLSRPYGITFNVGIFLNISPDHIGIHEHTSYEEYLSCKMQIFGQSAQMIVDNHESFWDEMSKKQQDEAITFSQNGPSDYYSRDYQIYQSPGLLGCKFDLEGKMKGEVILPIPGEFNVRNALAAIACADYMGIPKETILCALAHVTIRGRQEIIKEGLEFGRTVILDFAHNDTSFKNLFTTLRQYKPNRIVVVLGRDSHETEHRAAEEGRRVSELADFAVVTRDTEEMLTDDEAWLEADKDLIDTLVKSNTPHAIIPYRPDAIRYALEHTKEDDFVVLIGRCMDITLYKNGERVPWRQEDTVKEVLSEIYGKK